VFLCVRILWIQISITLIQDSFSRLLFSIDLKLRSVFILLMHNIIKHIYLIFIPLACMQKKNKYLKLKCINTINFNNLLFHFKLGNVIIVMHIITLNRHNLLLLIIIHLYLLVNHILIGI